MTCSFEVYGMHLKWHCYLTYVLNQSRVNVITYALQQGFTFQLYLIPVIVLMQGKVDYNLSTILFVIKLDKYHLCLSSGCLYRGRECRLVIHYEQGFSVLADPKLADGENGEEGAAHTPSRPTVLLSYPYEKLKMSSDDGVRMLSLDFGGKEGEIVSVFYFTLFSFPELYYV